MAVNIWGRMPDSRRNSFQVSKVKWESRSEMISVGSPFYFQTSLAKVIARSAAIFLCFLSGRKCTIFVNRSMTTHNWSHSSERGSCVMKSIAIDCHGV